MFFDHLLFVTVITFIAEQCKAYLVFDMTKQKKFQFLLQEFSFCDGKNRKLKGKNWVTEWENVRIRVIDLGSISPTFYAKLLCTQIPKAHNNTDDLIVLLRFLGSLRLKLHVNMLVKSTSSLSISISKSFLIHPSGVNFINIFCAPFS